MRVQWSVALVALVLAGCARGGPAADRVTGPGPTPPTPSSASTTPAPTDGGPLPTAITPVAPGAPMTINRAQVDDAAVPGGYREPATVDLAGTTVTLVGGGCDAVRAQVLEQDGTHVAVALVHTVTHPGPCTSGATAVPVSVTLSEPLGTRTLVLSEVRK